MALTFTRLDTWHNMGDLSVTFWDITLDSSYPSQGYAVTGNQFGLSNNLVAVIPQGLAYQPNQAQPGAYLAVTYDKTKTNLRVAGMNAAAGAGNPLTEVAAATNLAAYHVLVMVIGY